MLWWVGVGEWAEYGTFFVLTREREREISSPMGPSVLDFLYFSLTFPLLTDSSSHNGQGCFMTLVLYLESCSLTQLRTLPSTAPSSILIIVFYVYIRIKMNIIQAGFIFIHSLLLYSPFLRVLKEKDENIFVGHYC